MIGVDHWKIRSERKVGQWDAWFDFFIISSSQKKIICYFYIAIWFSKLSGHSSVPNRSGWESLNFRLLQILCKILCMYCVRKRSSHYSPITFHCVGLSLSYYLLQRRKCREWRQTKRCRQFERQCRLRVYNSQRKQCD